MDIVQNMGSDGNAGCQLHLIITHYKYEHVLNTEMLSLNEWE